MDGTKNIYAWNILNLFYLAVMTERVFCNVKGVNSPGAILKNETLKMDWNGSCGHAAITKSVKITI